jgi:hypothetical protein
VLLHVIVSFALAWFRTRSVGVLHERKPFTGRSSPALRSDQSVVNASHFRYRKIDFHWIVVARNSMHTEK